MKIVIQTTKGTIESPEFPEIVREPLKEKIDKLADDLMDSWFNHSVYLKQKRIHVYYFNGLDRVEFKKNRRRELWKKKQQENAI